MIKINNEHCIGCGICMLSCLHDAISLVEIKSGEYGPVIDVNKCSGCNKCEEGCNVFNKAEPVHTVMNTFFGYSSRQEKRRESSSGGIFIELASDFIRKYGCVAGAAFNKNGFVEHVLVDNVDDLSRLQGSKYCESKVWTVFREIERRLKAGEWILFSGVPCEVFSLKAFLKKDYSKLICCEVFCHGAPRVGVYRKYKELMERKYGKIINFNFRSKAEGWGKPNYKINFKNKTIVQSHSKNIYHLMFGTHHSLRRSCLKCNFRSIRRNADISLGDFWGIEKYYPKENMKDGVSAVLVSTEKGKKLVDECKNIILKKCQVEEITDKNKWLIECFEKPAGYEKFNHDFISMNTRLFFLKYKFKYFVLDRIKRKLRC